MIKSNAKNEHQMARHPSLQFETIRQKFCGSYFFTVWGTRNFTSRKEICWKFRFKNWKKKHFFNKIRSQSADLTLGPGAKRGLWFRNGTRRRSPQSSTSFGAGFRRKSDCCPAPKILNGILGTDAGTTSPKTSCKRSHIRGKKSDGMWRIWASWKQNEKFVCFSSSKIL